MHEQGETRGTDTGYVNTYGQGVPGRAGEPLPLIFGFERPEYPSVSQAVLADVLRSLLSGTAATRPSGSDYLRTNPSSDLLRQLMMLWQIQSTGMGRTGP
jgi:hypothetical protein